MIVKQMTDKEQTSLYAKIINNLLPDYKEGDILCHYWGGRKVKCKFIRFTHDDEGHVFCVLDHLASENPNAPYDFDSTFSYPLEKVWKESTK